MKFPVFAIAAAALLACGDEAASPPPTDGGGGTNPGTTSASGGGSTTTTSSTSSDGGSGGAGGSGPVDCSSLPLCDSFEQVSVGAAPDAALWEQVSPSCSGTGSLAVDDTQAHSGSQSLKISGAGGYCNHVFAANSSVIASLGDVVYARFFVRFADPLGDSHTTFLAMKDSADGDKDLRMGGQNKILMMNRESDDATLPALSPAGMATSLEPASQSWLCIELSIDQQTGELITWVDGAPIDGLHVDDTSTPDIDAQWLNQTWVPALTDFKIGWESYGGQAMDLWFDDVALASSRIGCDDN